MERIRRQVAVARRRLAFQQFLAAAPWWCFGALIVAAVGLAAPKIWFVEHETSTWTIGWLVGSIAGATLLAFAWTLLARRRMIDAAMELDKRFGLKERVSSALSMSEVDQQTEAGIALIDDATKRIEQIQVKERFAVATGKQALLPLIPALVIFALLTFVPDAKQEKLNAASETAALREGLKKSSEALRKKLAKKPKTGDQKPTPEAEAMFSQLQKQLDDLARDGDVNRKKALVKLNDLAKQVEQNRKSIGDADKMRKQFSQLKKIERGPAEKLASALQEGDFQKALEQLKKLSEQMKDGELSADSKQQLTQQLKQMKQAMQDMVDAHEQAKRDLERQIQQKQAEGDLEAASKLQRQLDRLEQQNKQMDRMQQMAQQLGEAQQAMQEGNESKAAEQLEELSEALSEMQAEMGQLESLDEVMDAIAQAKEMCRGNEPGDMLSEMGGMGMDQFSEMPGDGLGEGQGFGDRPEQETETGEYDARERHKPRAGEAVRVGDAFGPNRAGMSLEDVKEQILSELSNDADPLTDQKLPRSQRDHIKQYFQRSRQ